VVLEELNVFVPKGSVLIELIEFIFVGLERFVLTEFIVIVFVAVPINDVLSTAADSRGTKT
jgi:hypothetical protein